MGNDDATEIATAVTTTKHQSREGEYIPAGAPDPPTGVVRMPRAQYKRYRNLLAVARLAVESLKGNSSKIKAKIVVKRLELSIGALDRFTSDMLHRPTNRPPPFKWWTDEKLAVLRKKRQDGVSAATLAKEYGLSVTRINQLLRAKKR